MLGEDDFVNNVSAINQQGRWGGSKFNKGNPRKNCGSIVFDYFIS